MPIRTPVRPPEDDGSCQDSSDSVEAGAMMAVAELMQASATDDLE
jgi:hypothetical protein